ncbi:hypothetical protein BGZ75_000296 [Mortierella antarctica]|nr:hypothetical protein BGZ75_000296 [Mortierella antarctica]
MSLRITARRSLNVALVHNSPAIARVPVLARTFSTNTTLQQENELLKHAPGWKRENASESEASVKADREPHPANVEHMQNETVRHLKNDGSTSVQDLKEEAEKKGKEFLDKAKSEIPQQEESVIDGVKAGAQKVTDFVKGSVDSAKKAVGMDSKK